MQKNKKGGAFSLFLAAAALLLTVCFIAPAATKTVNTLIIENGGAMAAKPDGFVAIGVKNTSSADVSLTGATLSDEPNEQTTDLAAVTQGGEYVSPADVLELQKNYTQKYKNAEVAGNVKEEFFDIDAATFVSGKTAVRSTTSEQFPDFSKLIAEGSSLQIEDKAAPAVLIFHTHTTEGYLLSDNGVFYKNYETRSTNPSQNMVRVGDEICRVLESNGIGVIHDTNIYDSTYNGAYARSREAVLDYLNEYPSIQIVLDVHRDAIRYSDTCMGKPTALVNNQKAAQIMIISGAEEGSITDFPDWEQNLRFALEIQSRAQSKYTGLMKPLFFCQRKYNMDVTKYSLLLEIGSDGNTLEEAVYSANLIGNVLTEIINEHTVKD